MSAGAPAQRSSSALTRATPGSSTSPVASSCAKPSDPIASSRLWVDGTPKRGVSSSRRRRTTPSSRAAGETSKTPPSGPLGGGRRVRHGCRRTGRRAPVLDRFSAATAAPIDDEEGSFAARDRQQRCRRGFSTASVDAAGGRRFRRLDDGRHRRGHRAATGTGTKAGRVRRGCGTCRVRRRTPEMERVTWLRWHKRGTGDGDGDPRALARDASRGRSRPRSSIEPATVDMVWSFRRRRNWRRTRVRARDTSHTSITSKCRYVAARPFGFGA